MNAKQIEKLVTDYELSLLSFDTLIVHGYPLLGALCAGLLLVLCLPVCPRAVTAPTSE